MSKKGHFLAIMFFLVGGMLHAQAMRITGKIAGPAADSVELNFPFTAFTFPETSVFASVDKHGRFSYRRRDSLPRMVLLRYQGREEWLVVRPNRPLKVVIDATKQNWIGWDPKASPENTLLSEVVPTAGHWFSADLGWSLDSLVGILLPAARQSLDSLESRVHSSRLPKEIQLILRAEARFGFYHELYHFCGKWMHQWYNYYSSMPAEKSQRKQDLVWTEIVVRIAIALEKIARLPTEEELAASPSARRWLDDYGEWRMMRLLKERDLAEDKTVAERAFRDSIKMPQQQEDSILNIYGRTSNDGYYVLYCLERSSMLPNYAAANWLEGQIVVDCCKGKSTRWTRFPLALLDSVYPGAARRETCARLIQATEDTYTRNLGDPEIHIRPDASQISTLADLISPYAGKVVYVDCWGSWCHACLEEMRFAPELKRAFKEKGLVYLFLDVEYGSDEKQEEQAWRTYIYTDDLKGEHVRLSQQQLDKLWKEMNGGSMAFPRYLLFDRNGKLVDKDAKRPSEKDLLYREIEKYLP